MRVIKGFIELNDYRNGETTVALDEILEVQRVRSEPYQAAVKVRSRMPSDPWVRVIETYETVLARIREAS